ncbi:HEAT repeat-containing protein 7A [Tupaia chinensis]|uniref:HEAT repeat-containing protein 7A n=1 Tax=Tupaia chinensis TaxID=246437 RepID=L9KKG5_TUPCH|nr:HEAT repeat-containing protein 7A [Tupaia chinensis]
MQDSLLVPPQAFLFTYYGLMLQAEENSSTVRTHLQTLLETSHQWPKQREGIALTVGLAAARHLDDVWAVLDQFGRSAPIKWSLHSFSLKVAAKAKAHFLPWVDNVLSRMVFYFHYSSWDETLKQSFLTAAQTLMAAIGRGEGAHSYEFSQASELLECLMVLLEKEPQDVLCTPSRQQALHVASSLCKLRPPIDSERKSRLLATCLRSVLALPLLDTLQKHSCLFLEPPDIQVCTCCPADVALIPGLTQALYHKTMEALDLLLQSLITQNPTAEELHFLLSSIYVWLASEKAHERQRAVRCCTGLLKFLRHNPCLDVSTGPWRSLRLSPPKEDLKRVGQLVGMLAILCQDPNRPTQQSSLEGLGHLYYLLTHRTDRQPTVPRSWPAEDAQREPQALQELSQPGEDGTPLWSSGDQNVPGPAQQEPASVEGHIFQLPSSQAIKLVPDSSCGGHGSLYIFITTTITTVTPPPTITTVTPPPTITTVTPPPTITTVTPPPTITTVTPPPTITTVTPPPTITTVTPPPTITTVTPPPTITTVTPPPTITTVTPPPTITTVTPPPTITTVTPPPTITTVTPPPTITTVTPPPTITTVTPPPTITTVTPPPTITTVTPPPTITTVTPPPTITTVTPPPTITTVTPPPTITTVTPPPTITTVTPPPTITTVTPPPTITTVTPPPTITTVTPPPTITTEIMNHLSLAELTDLLWTAVHDLGSASPFRVQAAADILLAVVREHGAKLDTVANLGRAVHLRLCSLRVPQAKENALLAITLLARNHAPELVATFLDFSLPLDSHAFRLWRALGAEQPLSHLVLAALLAWLHERPLPLGSNHSPQPKEKTYLRSLAAMNTLHELQFAREFKAAVLEAYPELLLALLTQMHYVLELGVPGAPPPRQPAVEATPSPQSTSLEALKSLLSTTGHWHDFAHLELRGTWGLFCSAHTYPQGVGLLARYDGPPAPSHHQLGGVGHRATLGPL